MTNTTPGSNFFSSGVRQKVDQLMDILYSGGVNNPMDSIEQIMGFVMPYLPVSIAEKQALLEVDSVRERYITFLDLLIKTREDINIRIEMAKKVTDRVGKFNREAMLRE